MGAIHASDPAEIMAQILQPLGDARSRLWMIGDPLQQTAVMRNEDLQMGEQSLAMFQDPPLNRQCLDTAMACRGGPAQRLKHCVVH